MPILLRLTPLAAAVLHRGQPGLGQQAQVLADGRPADRVRCGEVDDPGRAGRERAIAEFSWAAIAARTVEIYRSVL